MIGKLRDFFGRAFGSSEEQARSDAEVDARALRLATATLLVQAMRADDCVMDIERLVVVRVLAEGYEMSISETTELVVLAEQQADQAISLHPLTKLLNEELSAAQKTWILELLWRVVYADGVKDAREEHLVRKIANLLRISHTDFIETRRRVELARTGKTDVPPPTD
jgi:uncharacterized tellurite resistance protein B-like protein